MKTRFFLTYLLLISCTSCFHHTVSISGEPATEYHDLLTSLSLERKFFGLEKVRYYTTATYRNMQLRKKYVEEYSKKFHFTEEEKTQLLAKELGEAQEQNVFVISHFATEKETARLAKAIATWRLALYHDNQERIVLEPTSVSQLPSNPVNQYFYPYITPWSKAYIVKFKRISESNYLQLRMDGTEGNLEFSWKQ